MKIFLGLTGLSVLFSYYLPALAVPPKREVSLSPASSYRIVERAGTGPGKVPPIPQRPGVGIELECRGIQYSNKRDEAYDVDPGIQAALKGASIWPVGKPAVRKILKDNQDYWKLTAEFPSANAVGIAVLIPEFIVDGTRFKIGSKGEGLRFIDVPDGYDGTTDAHPDSFSHVVKPLKEIGRDITKLIVSHSTWVTVCFTDVWKDAWAPITGVELTVDGFAEADWGRWTATKPSIFSGAKFTMWGKQVTAPLPLEQLQRCFMEITEQQKIACPLITDSRKQNNMRRVRKEHFQAKFKKIKDSDIDDSFLGFFSLVMSYILATPTQNKENGPKHSLPVMPRTDFATMYNLYVKDKLRQQLECSLLSDIIDELAVKLEPHNKELRQTGKNGEEYGVTDQKHNPNYHFKWAKKIAPGESLDGARPASQKMTWVSKATDLRSGILGVGTWIDGLESSDERKEEGPSEDRLAAMDDLLRGGQIGSLGRKTELVSNTARVMPIFEFRDLAEVEGSGLEKDFEKLDRYLMDLYVSNVHEHKERNSMKKISDTLRTRAQTPQNSADARSGKDDPCNCHRKRLKMQNPGQCQKCPAGQIRITGNMRSAKAHTCKECPKGQKPNRAGDRCVLECREDQKLSLSGKTCELDCPKGKKSDATGAKCAVDCPKGKRPNSAGNECTIDCPTGKKANVVGSKCELDCPMGKEENKAGTSCVQECPGKKIRAAHDKCICKNGAMNDKCDLEQDRKAESNLRESLRQWTEAGEKDRAKQEEAAKQREKTDNDTKKQQHKMCLAFLATGVASETFNPDELEEAGEEWPEDVVIDWKNFKPLTESNISLPPPPTTVGVIMMDAGVPGVGAAAQGITNAIRESIRAGSRAGPKAAGSKTGRNIVGNGGKAADKGSDISKKTIQGFKSEKAYRPCLLGASLYLTSAGGAKLTMSERIPRDGYLADLNDELIGVQLCADKDCGYEEPEAWSSYPDALNRGGRIEIGKCVADLSDWSRGKVSGFTVTGGCCVFYKGVTCNGAEAVFAANYRQDQNLQGDSNDVIESFMCNHDQCVGLPYGDQEDQEKHQKGVFSEGEEAHGGSGLMRIPPAYEGGVNTKDMPTIESKPRKKLVST